MRLVLVHGSAHGAWAWEAVEPLLRAAGHDPVAIDLPGRAGDATPHRDITLESLGRAVLAAAGARAVLVGHSAAGFAIEMAAALDPSRIAGLVHLCTYVPAPGASIVNLRRAQETQPLKGALAMSADGASYSFVADRVGAILCPEAPPDVAARAIARLVPEAVAPQAEPFPRDLADLPRHYIRCTRDGIIPPAFQARMTWGWPEGTVTQLDSDHAPYLSAPERLAGLIDRAARTMA